jgi:hypothetical protein
MPGFKGLMDHVTRLIAGARWLTREWPRPCAGVGEGSMREPAPPTATGGGIDPNSRPGEGAQSS